MKFPPTKWLRDAAWALASAFALSVSAQSTDPTGAPVLRIVVPQTGSSGPAATPLTVVAEYDGPDGNRIRQVRVEADGTDLGEAVPLPQVAIFPPPPPRFGLAWPSPPVGLHRIRATATVASPGGGSVSRIVSEAVAYSATNALDSVDTVTVEALKTEITEGSGPQDVFAIRRTGPASRPLEVFFQLGGQAVPGLDYALPFGLLRARFEAGSTSATVVLRPQLDTRTEGRETVTLELVQPDPPSDLLFHYRVGTPARAESSIVDAGFHPPASVAWMRPEAGSAFTVGSAVRLEVSAVDPSGFLPSVQFFATDAAGTERRILGRSDIAFFVAPTNGTPIGHSLDWISTNAFPGINRIRAVATTAAGETVTSPDLLLLGIPSTNAPVVRVSTEVATASEAAPESTFVFRIERDGPADAPLTVRYSVSGTATRGVDYQLERDPCPLCGRPTLFLPDGWVVFEPGVRSIRIGGTAFTDRQVEGDETVELHVDPPLDRETSYRVDPDAAVARATIEDGDLPTELPTVTIHTLDGVASETNGTDGLRFEVRRSGPTDSPLTVHYRFSGSAGYLVDFRRLADFEGVDPTLALPAPLILEIPAGGTNVLLDLRALPDTRIEGEETVVVTLVQPEPAPNVRLRPTYRIGRPESARGLIRDTPTEDGAPPTVRISASVAGIREPAPGTAPDTGTFVLTRSGPTASPLTVRYGVSGTASNGRDYGYLDGDVTFPAGAESAEIRVNPLPDLLVESDETVAVTVLQGRHYVPADDATARLVIRDAVSGPDPMAWIRFLTPVDGTHVTLPADVVVRAVAVDLAADIRRVEFLDGETLVGVSEHLTRDAVIPGAPRFHEWTWTNPPAGPHRLHARADVRGTAVVSEAVDFVVVAGPTNTPSRPHPADVANPSFVLDASEFQAYAEAWRNGSPWPGTAAAIPPGFVSRAGYLVASGGAYARRVGSLEPLAWIPAPATNSAGHVVAKDESTKPVAVFLSDTALSGFVDTSVSDLSVLWPEGMPEREPLSFAVLEVQRPTDRTNETDLVLRLLPATGTRCQVAEVVVGPGVTVTNLSDNGVFDPTNGVLRFGPFPDDANRRVTATLVGSTAGLPSGVGSFDGRDSRLRVVALPSSTVDPARPRITSVERRSDGAVQVVVVDDDDSAGSASNTLECSSDLVNWHRIGEAAGTAVGSALLDADATETPFRYYRVVRR